MTELQILSGNENIVKVNQKKIIEVTPVEENVIYKFIVGIDGIWKTIQDYSEENKCVWVPNWKGNYTVMVQAKKRKSKKPFDYMTKSEMYVEETVDQKKKSDEEAILEKSIVGAEEAKGLQLISDVLLDKKEYYIGDKVTINVDCSDKEMMCRFLLNTSQGWETLVDYSSDSSFVFTPTKIGSYEILIESKRPKSEEKFDDFATINFEVKELGKIEIRKFISLSKKRIVDEEISFMVETNHENRNNILYKFSKINENGDIVCLQDYSSSSTISYIEKSPGRYKLLCYVRSMLSNSEYDDRALMVYSVKPYDSVIINNISSDVKSPQGNGNVINIKADASGGRELIYKFIIDGPEKFDTGYIRAREYAWTPKEAGEYLIKVFTKDASCDKEYEDFKEMKFIINHRQVSPIRITNITSNNKCLLVGEKANIKVSAEGGIDLKYKFIVYKDGEEKEKVDYSSTSMVDFIAEEKGDYVIEARVKDKYSDKEFDNNCFVKLKIKDYMPAKIDYVIVPDKENHVVLDNLEIEAIVQNTSKILMKYILKINGREVEESDYNQSKKIKFVPKCPGKYTFSILCKNKKSDEKYDDKKEINIYIYENKPVINTKIRYNIDEIKLNKEVTFHVSSVGGKDVCYEFYVMESGNWTKVQDYSRKNYYTFIPFIKGQHRIMAMAKSYHKKVNYEDYDEMIFEVS